MNDNNENVQIKLKELMQNKYFEEALGVVLEKTMSDNYIIKASNDLEAKVIEIVPKKSDLRDSNYRKIMLKEAGNTLEYGLEEILTLKQKSFHTNLTIMTQTLANMEKNAKYQNRLIPYKVQTRMLVNNKNRFLDDKIFMNNKFGYMEQIVKDRNSIISDIIMQISLDKNNLCAEKDALLCYKIIKQSNDMSISNYDMMIKVKASTEFDDILSMFVENLLVDEVICDNKFNKEDINQLELFNFKCLKKK